MKDEKLEKITGHNDEQLLEKISAGLIRETPNGYEIYDANKDGIIAICQSYESAEKIAHENNVSALEIWELPDGMAWREADDYYREFNKKIL